MYKVFHLVIKIYNNCVILYYSKTVLIKNKIFYGSTFDLIAASKTDNL